MIGSDPQQERDAMDSSQSPIRAGQTSCPSILMTLVDNLYGHFLNVIEWEAGKRSWRTHQ
jgi:hypothetical protein